jgi:hypothetical protein
VIAEDVAFDDTYAIVGFLKRCIEYGFQTVFAKDIQMLWQGRLHARIKVSSHVHELQLTRSIMPVFPFGPGITAIYVRTKVYIFTHTAPF